MIRTLPFCLATVLLFGLHSFAPAQTANRPVPPDFVPYTFVQSDSGNHGHFAFTYFKIRALNPTPLEQSKSFLLDPQGYLLWYRSDNSLQNVGDFKYNPTTNQYQYFEVYGPNDIEFILLNDSLQKTNGFRAAGGWKPDGHDFQVLNDGNFVITTTTDSVLDLSAYTFNGLPGSDSTNCACNGFQKIDASNNLLWQWNSCEHLHPSEFIDGYPYDSTLFDFCHINAVDEDSDGHYLVSMRHTDAIYKIHNQTGAVIWKLGGKNGSFTMPNDSGFSGQHDIRRLPNGDYSLFDNGNFKPAPQITRAVRYQLDTTNWTATRTWEYVPNPSFYARAMGSYQYGSNMNLVNYGLVYRPWPSAELFDGNGQVAAQLFFPDSVMSYRGNLFQPQTGIPRPPVSCAEVGGMVELQAPPGYDAYIWSTGDTSATVQVQLGSTYQVWVPFGEGMVGSDPIVVPMNGGCPLVGSPEPEVGGGRPAKLVQVFDLTGRPLKQAVAGQVYIELYSDGSVRKRVWLR